jgi:hypothetical protein
MKKVIAAVFLGLLLNGCTTNSDGTFSAGVEGSKVWHATAGHQELTRYYLKSGVDEICYHWELFDDYDQNSRVRNRNAMKEALTIKKVDPLMCMKLPN